MKKTLRAFALGAATMAVVGVCAQSASAGVLSFSMYFDINDPVSGAVEHVEGGGTAEDTKTTDVISGFSGYKVLTFTGTQDGNAITLLPSGNFHSNDNLLDSPSGANSQPFDIYGLAYQEVDPNGEKYAIYYDVGLKGRCDCKPDSDPPFFVTDFFVPEPNSVVLVVLGALGILAGRRQRSSLR